LREAGKRRGRGAIISSGRIAAFWCGLGTMAIALASPLDTATATVFTAHMIQHVLLIAVGPPLILIGKPMTVMMIGLPRSWRRPIATITHRIPPIAAVIGILTTPIVAFLMHAGTLWIWHDPGLYQAAVRHEWIHAIEHGTFIVTAFLYWWAIIPVGGHARHTVGPAVGILSVFGMGMQGAALGAILTFWGSVIYPVYDGRSELWGLSSLSDQRLAGLIMWIPAGSVYVAIAMMLLVTWFRQDQDELPPPALEAAPSSFSAETTKHGQTALG
jgi:putative membrane protein